MKTCTRLWLCLTTVLACLPLMSRADNTTWQEAQPIALGERVMQTHQQLNHWTKIDLEAGQQYNIEMMGGSETYNYSNYLRLYAATDLTTPLKEERYSPYTPSFTFSPSTTGTYYLHSLFARQSDEQSGYVLTAAQQPTNTTLDAALEVTEGTEVLADMSQSGNLYYQMNLKADHTYEFSAPHLTASAYLSITNPEGVHILGGQLSKETGHTHYFTPPADGTYYAILTSYNGYVFRWAYRAVTDYRVPQYAQPIEVGQSTTLEAGHAHPNKTYWYQMQVEAGKYYEVDFSTGGEQDYIDLYLTTWTAQPYRILGEKYLLRAEQTGPYYLCLYRRDDQTAPTFRLSEQQGDSRLQPFAKPITLDQRVDTRHYSLSTTSQWYRIDLEGERAYELEFGPQTSSSLHLHLLRLDPETQDLTPVQDIEGGTKTLLYLPHTGTYYLQSQLRSTNGPNYSSYYDYYWTLQPHAGDNRVPQYATPITLDALFTVNHRTYPELWYKVDLQPGVLYELDWSATPTEDNEVHWYAHYDSTAVLTTSKNKENREYFTPTEGGTYWLKMSERWVSLKYILREVKDNRACAYASLAQPENSTALVGAVPIAAESMPRTGLWYTLDLQQGHYYQLDASKMPDKQLTLYRACGDIEPLQQSRGENILISPRETGTYRLHVAHMQPSYYYGQPVKAIADPQPWALPYAELEQGDDRLCQHATPLTTTDAVPVSLDEGKRTHWYAVSVTKDKWYRLDLGTEGKVEVFSTCDDALPVATYQGSNLYTATADATLLLRLTTPATTGMTLRWREVRPDGLSCETPLPLTLGQTITTTPDDGMPNGGTLTTWYRLVPEHTGTYHLHLYTYDTTGEDREHHFWAVGAREGCQGRFLGGAGHMGNLTDAYLNLEAGKSYLFMVESFLESATVNQRWSLRLSEHQYGHLRVTLKEGDAPLDLRDPLLTLYRKVDGDILLCDTLEKRWDEMGLYELPLLDYGTYLLHFQPHAQQAEGYVPQWYQQAGQWQEATEIVVDGILNDLTFSPYRPAALLGTGSVTLEGSVTPVLAQDETVPTAGISVSLYRRIDPQGAPALTLLRAPRRAGHIADGWEYLTSTQTDATGHYRIDGLPQGSYLLLVDLPGYTTQQAQVVVEATEDKTYEAPAFLVNTEDKCIITTGLTSLTTDDDASARQPIYDLQGRRRTSLQRGVNIVARKKILLK